MNWSDISSIVGKAAPVIGGLLGGPAGAAVGGLVSSVLGVENTPAAVSAALAADPQALAKVQEAEINAKVQLQQLMVTAANNVMLARNAQFAAEAADRASARDLAAKQPNDHIRPALTVLLLLGTFFMTAAIFSGLMDGQLRDATISLTAGTVIGAVLTMTKEALSFWFGTTQTAQHSATAMQQFATAPGTVTLDSIAHG